MGELGRVVAAAGLGAALLLAGCGNDDGARVRGDGSASASGSGSGARSGSGLAGQDLSGTTSDPQVQKAVADYRTWVVAEVDGLVADTAKFTDAVRAGDLAEAKRQFAPSRVRWERIEPIAAWSPRSTARSTPGSTTSRASTTRSSPAGTGSSTTCGSSARPRAPGPSPTSWTRTSPPSTGRSSASSSRRRRSPSARPS